MFATFTQIKHWLDSVSSEKSAITNRKLIAPITAVIISDTITIL